jgi:hypothetical protein
MLSIMLAMTSRKRGWSMAVAQVGQAVDDGHAGARELFQVEAEVDQFAPGMLALR